MQYSQLPIKWVKPFAVDDANKVELPVTTAALGRASQSLGFPPITMQPPESGGVPPQGEDFNGAMYQVARFAWWGMAGGPLPFDATWAANAAITGYPQGARIAAADLQGEWISTIDNNQNNPDTVGTGWVPGSAYGATSLTGLTNANVTLTPAQAAKGVIRLAGTLTGNIQIIFPNWLSAWIIINNCTGAFSVTVKTAAGSGVVVSQAGGMQEVFGDGTNLIAFGGSSATPLLVGTPTLAMHAAQFGQIGGVYAVRGLSAQNNTGTPTTQYDVTCNMVALRNPTTGTLAVVNTPGTLTNNISTAGPAANGRDQAGAFTASSWVHFYYIWNGTTLATLSSAVAPPTGPTLPSGYTHWAYIGAVVLNASTQLNNVRIKGAWATYDSALAVLTGIATVNTAFSTATAVPPNAMEWKAIVQNLALSSAGSGAYSLTLFLDSYQAGLQGQGAASAVVSVSGGSCTLPNNAQSANYRLNLGTGSGPTTTIQAQGYSLPNGA